MPKKVKFRKQQRGRMTGKAWRGSTLSFGEFGLKAMECGWVTNRQIEAARIAMTRFIKRGGKVWIRIFPDKPITKKPPETRMGKGKGAPEAWVCVIKPGRILFEMEGVSIANRDRSHASSSAEVVGAYQVHHAPPAGSCRGSKKNRTQRTMKANRISGFGRAELQRQSYDAQEQLFRFRFQMGMGQTEGLKKYRALKKDRARMLTALSAKRLAGETIPVLEAAPAPKRRGKSHKGRESRKGQEEVEG